MRRVVMRPRPRSWSIRNSRKSALGAMPALSPLSAAPRGPVARRSCRPRAAARGRHDRRATGPRGAAESGLRAGMAPSADFLEFLMDQLRGLGRITTRRMFSGAGLYCEGVIFALIL